MLLSEKEARDKWCPFSMPNYDPMRALAPRNCEVHECMAWRWANDPDGHPVMKRVAPPSECPDCKGKGFFIDPVDDALPSCSTCEGSGNVGHYEQMGFCGMAGRP